MPLGMVRYCGHRPSSYDFSHVSETDFFSDIRHNCSYCYAPRKQPASINKPSELEPLDRLTKNIRFRNVVFSTRVHTFFRSLRVISKFQGSEKLHEESSMLMIQTIWSHRTKLSSHADFGHGIYVPLDQNRPLTQAMGNAHNKSRLSERYVTQYCSLKQGQKTVTKTSSRTSAPHSPTLSALPQVAATFRAYSWLLSVSFVPQYRCSRSCSSNTQQFLWLGMPDDMFA